jgi:hypothetical protein
MIKEDHVSSEIAKLLKEKGFPQNPQICNTAYTYKGKFSNNAKSFWNPLCFDLFGRQYFMAPTHQMAMKWLREKYGIFIAINNDDLDFNWQCYDLINRGSTLDPKILSESYAGYKTYEEAVEAALKYALENLI